MECDSFVIMKAGRLNTPAGIYTRALALTAAFLITERAVAVRGGDPLLALSVLRPPCSCPD